MQALLWGGGWASGVEGNNQLFLTSQWRIVKRDSDRNPVFRLRQFANLDCRSLTLYKAQKAWVTFKTGLHDARCETAVLLSDLIAPVFKHAGW